MPLQPSKLKSLLSRYLATNSFGLGILFTNQFASSKILGTMATKMVATWRVVGGYTWGVITLQDFIYVTLRVNLTDKLKVLSRFLCLSGTKSAISFWVLNLEFACFWKAQYGALSQVYCSCRRILWWNHHLASLPIHGRVMKISSKFHYSRSTNCNNLLSF